MYVRQIHTHTRAKRGRESAREKDSHREKERERERENREKRERENSLLRMIAWQIMYIAAVFILAHFGICASNQAASIYARTCVRSCVCARTHADAHVRRCVCVCACACSVHAHTRICTHKHTHTHIRTHTHTHARTHTHIHCFADNPSATGRIQPAVVRKRGSSTPYETSSRTAPHVT